MSKMARIAHLNIWNTSYGQKKGWESNWQFDSRPQKVENQPDLLVLKGRATYHWKALNESYNFALYRISIGGLLAKLWCSKVARVPTWAISRLPLESPRTKIHLDVGSMASHRVYYKGEGGGFPQVQAMVSLVCLCCPWLVLTPKVLQLRTNHLVWVLCRPMWVSEAYQLFLVPSRSSSMPLYPSKCCEPGSMPRFLPLPLFSTWTHIWVPQGVGSASTHFRILLQLLLWKAKHMFRRRSLTFSLSNLMMNGYFITKDNFHTLMDLVIVNPTLTNMVQWTSTMTRHATMMAIQEKTRSYTEQTPSNDFILLAIKTYGCLHFRFDSFFIACA
jgi:hypothetical protein